MDTLQKYKDKSLFEVPEHYFERLQQGVIQRIMMEEKMQKMQKRWISIISVAASITLIVMLSYFLFENRNFDEHFYVSEEIIHPQETVISHNPNHFAESVDIHVNEATEIKEKKTETIVANAKETIVYRAVDFYVDDYETYSFCEVMYDLECYYDY